MTQHQHAITAAGPQPLVSIVLATYNGAVHLEQQLESVFLQSYENIEVIAVDDASADGTVEILKAFASRHPNMKWTVNEHNLGYIRAFEKGCRMASGVFISLCDQDDYWHPDKVRKLVDVIGANAMAYCDSLICDKDLNSTGRKISDVANLRNFDDCLQQAVFCRIYGHASLVSRSFCESAMSFLPVIPHDWWLSFNAAFSGGIVYLDEPLIRYRQHAGNLFGAATGGSSRSRRQRKKVSKKEEREKIRVRIEAFYQRCPAELTATKKILGALCRSYRNFYPWNGLWRVALFLRHKDRLLVVKKRSSVRKILFCFKMIWMIK